MLIQNRRLGDVVFIDNGNEYHLKHMEHMIVSDEVGKKLTNLVGVIDMDKIVRPTTKEETLNKEVEALKAKIAELENKKSEVKEERKKGK